MNSFFGVLGDGSRTMRIAIHHNAWHVCGGGELYVGVLAEELAKEHDVTLLLTTPFDGDRLQGLLGLDFSGVELLSIVQPPVDPLRSGRWDRLKAELNVMGATRRFDVAIRVATGRIPLSLSPRNLLHVQVPFRRASRRPRELVSRIWNRIAGLRYERFFFNSRFTASMVSPISLRNGRGFVLYPPVEMATKEEPDWWSREPVILSVGRFAERGHCKRQLELVRAFKSMISNGLEGWRLVLAGSVPADSSSRDYLVRVREEASGLPVEVRVDIPRQEVLRLYCESRIYWHATGMGLDEWKYPDRVEHFGITTVEAMARGCLPIVIDAGGQREIVKHGVNGYRWSSEEELADYTWRAIRAPARHDEMTDQAVHAARSFSRREFERRALSLVVTNGKQVQRSTFVKSLVCPECWATPDQAGQQALQCRRCGMRWIVRSRRVVAMMSDEVEKLVPTISCPRDPKQRARQLNRAVSKIMKDRPGSSVLHVTRRPFLQAPSGLQWIAATREEVTESELPPVYEGALELAGSSLLPFPAHTFDAVLFETDMLPVSEAARVLRVGGLLLVPEPVNGPPPAEVEPSFELSIQGVLVAYRRRGAAITEWPVSAGSPKGSPNAD